MAMLGITKKLLKISGVFLLVMAGWLYSAVWVNDVQAAEPIINDQSGCTTAKFRSDNPDHKIQTMQLDCAFVTQRDRIDIYLHSGVFDPNTPWRNQVNQDNSTWIFEAGAKGTANLIINFYKQNNDVVADLYDSQKSDSRVDYNIDGNGQVQIVESHFPTVKVTAHGGWWNTDSKINFNLDIQTDGPVMAMASFDRFLNRIKHDGKPDFNIVVRDPQNIGTPQYDFRYSTADLPADWGLYRVNLAVDEKPAPNTKLDYSILWPFLGIADDKRDARFFAQGDYNLLPDYDVKGRVDGLVQAYHHHSPPIQVAWLHSKITFVAEITPTRASDHGWFTYSHHPYVPGQVYQTDFEAPFDFYNIGGNNDNVPDLTVRSEYYPAADPYFLFNYIYKQPTRMVRYSWNQGNPGQWNYSLNMLGRNDLQQQEIKFGDVVIRTVPYNSYPQQILANKWDALNFVEAVDGFAGEEGIYVWSGFSTIRNAYLLGNDVAPNLQDFTADTVDPGYRGEFAIKPQLEPKVYFSPLDRRLHLLQADYGFWNIDGKNSVVYSNPAKGDYITQWKALSTSSTGQTVITTTREMDVASTHLLYTDDAKNEVVIRQAAVPPALFVTKPPTNFEERQVLEDKLNANKPNFEAQDFKQMMSQFAGPMLSISNAQLQDYRRVGDAGFRFVLVLQPGYIVQGEDLLGVGQREPGSYMVSYAGKFVIQPLTPAQPFVQKVTLLAGNVAFVQSKIFVEIGNNGLTDAKAVSVTITLRSPTNVIKTLTTSPQDLIAGSTTKAAFDWTPNEVGKWSIVVNVPNAAKYNLDVQTKGTKEPDLPWILGMANQNLPLLLVLLTCIVVFGFIFGRIFLIRTTVTRAE